MTRYNPDGTIASSVTTQSGGPGQIGSTDFNQLGEEDDYDYSEEIDQSVTQQTLTRRVRQVAELVHDRLTDEAVNKRKIRIRSRRQTNRAKELEKELNCGATQCTIIKCSAGPITTNNNVVFKLRARIWAQTISEVIFSMNSIKKLGDE